MSKSNTTPDPLSGFNLNELTAVEAASTPEERADVARRRAVTKPATEGPAASSLTRGCRDGYSRHMCVIPLEVIDNLRSLSLYFGRTESAVVTAILQNGIEQLVAKYGAKCLKGGGKDKNLF